MNNYAVRNTENVESMTGMVKRLVSLFCILSLLLSFPMAAFAELELPENDASNSVLSTGNTVVYSEDEFRELWEVDSFDGELPESGEESNDDYDSGKLPEDAGTEGNFYDIDDASYTDDDFNEHEESTFTGNNISDEESDGFTGESDTENGLYENDDFDERWEEITLEEEFIYSEQFLASQWNGVIQWPIKEQHDVCSMDQPAKGTKGTEGYYKGHDGIDVVCGIGTEVYPVAPGTVHKVLKGNGAAGNELVLKHPNMINGKTYYSVYMHLSKFLCNENDEITAEDLNTPIALSGNSGGNYDPHLHFEVYQTATFRNIGTNDRSKPGNKNGEYDAIRKTSFEIYMNNPDALIGYARFQDGCVKKSAYGKWIEENCTYKSTKKGYRWVYEGGKTVSSTLVYVKSITSADGKHRYERYDYSAKWTAAKAFCESKGGHLVTILSAAEQSDIMRLLKDSSKNIYFIGASDDAAEGTWKWVTGEAFSYSNWDKDKPEPSNALGEDYAAIMGKAVGDNKQAGEWIDIYNYGDNKYSNYNLSQCGFICEYDLGNTSSPSSPTAAKTVNSSDGLHRYVRYDSSLKWTAAKTFCEQNGGHLVTILNAAEQNNVLSVLNGCTKNVYFIGGSDTAKEGTWTWVTGEAFSFTRWDQDYTEPSNKSGENYAAIMGKDVGKNKQVGDWIDIYNEGDSENAEYSLNKCGFVCEYDYVLYDANGGTGGPASAQLKKFNTDLTLSTVKPKRDGYTFLGWSTNKNATTAQYPAGGTYKKNEAVKLYAIWEVNKLNVWYYALRGDVTATGYTVSHPSGSILKDDFRYVEAWPYNVSKKLISAETLGLYRPGYTFAGWKLSSSDTVFSPQKAITMQEFYPAAATVNNVTAMLYAVWTPVEVSSALSLPENLKTIESEAFVSVGADAIIVPTSVETIADDAFSEDAILIGEWGSPIQLYAADKGFPFIELKDYVNHSVLP